ncbi:MAG: carboxypeptidase regulatory-like domain-containing protein, partial [Candidatus Eremiobacteraeota bacterium]|nr:carboxypeptidase regulatory-like domain-containing protein [Candidatus Eremiobacteraeota bacterium]
MFTSCRARGAVVIPPLQRLTAVAAALGLAVAASNGAAIAAPSAIVVGTGTVQGFVTTSDGTPVTAAVVVVSGNGPARTLPVGTKGGFVFTGLPSGTYVVRATARGYDAVSGRTIDVEAGKMTNVDLVMARSSSSLVTIGQVRAGSGAALSTSSAPTTTVQTQTYAARGTTYVSQALNDDISTTLVHPLGGSLALPTAVALRGPDPTETLIDIDGHQVNSGNTGSFDLSLLDPADYSNVELVKGISPSSLVGPDTIDGAINIRTLEPTAQRHGLVRVFSGSYDSFGETLQSTGTMSHLGYALSLHRTTTAGEVNQDITNSTTGDLQHVGSAVSGSTALGKLRYTFGSGGDLTLSFHDQSDVRDLSAALSSFPGPASPSASGDAVALHPFAASSSPSLTSFAGTTLQAHNAGYALDARIPLGRPDASGVSPTTALFRHYTSLSAQSVFGPGADTSPYLNSDRDILSDNSLEIDRQLGSGSLSLQYGIRNENLVTDFATGVVNDQAVLRRPFSLREGVARPLDSGTAASSSASQITLGQTQRTAALRYTGDLSAKFHVALAAYASDYSTFGSSVDPRLGFSWTPNAQ